MKASSLRDQLESAAMTAGAAGFGICSAEPFLEVRRELQQRKRDGHAAGMYFTFGDPERSTDVRETFPWAQRLVVVASSYLPAAGHPGPPEPGTARIARFSTEDHYEPLRRGLAELAGLLTNAGYRAEVLADDNRLVDRAAAVRAGVGWWGKNTMVLRPKDGPWVLLGSVVTDAVLPVDEPMERGCGTCTACLPACPTGALVAPGVLDARRCIAYWAQAPGIIPREIREAWGDRLYGCDDCLDACPPGDRIRIAATEPRGRVDLVDLLGMEDDSILETYQRFYVPRRRARYLRRNALVALGHAPSDEGGELLASYVRHDDPLLRLHAVWALGWGHASKAAAVLNRAIDEEADPEVLGEIAHALGR